MRHFLQWVYDWGLPLLFVGMFVAFVIAMMRI